jgi:hypothetical protein
MQVKKSNPERFCLLEYDKLIIDQKIYVWNDVISQVRKNEKNTHCLIFRELNGSQGYVIARYRTLWVILSRSNNLHQQPGLKGL